MNKKNKAFTLAEVLITLGIIGTVAAMTIPSLMMNYQKNTWETGLKKNYSMFVTACERMMADDNVNFANETRLYRRLLNSPNSADTRDVISEYFKTPGSMGVVAKDSDLNIAGPTTQDAATFTLPDGTIVNIAAQDMTFRIGVDVNGSRNPNKNGSDRFAFILDRRCTLVDVNIPADSDCTTSDNAYYCFKEVMDNGWKIY